MKMCGFKVFIQFHGLGDIYYSRALFLVYGLLVNHHFVRHLYDREHIL